MKIIAHRGYVTNEFQENTLTSISQAFKLGADMVEFDVRKTKDQIWILHHDENYYSSPNPISETSYEKLNEIATTENFELTTLDKVIQEFNDKQLVIECKLQTIQEGMDLAKYLQEMNWSKNGIVSSFSKNTLKGIRNASPDTSISILGFVLTDDEWKTFHRKYRLHSISPNYKGVTSHKIELAHGESLEIIVWTVNSDYHIRNLLKQGVDAVVTDNLEVGLHVRDDILNQEESSPKITKSFNNLKYE